MDECYRLPLICENMRCFLLCVVSMPENFLFSLKSPIVSSSKVFFLPRGDESEKSLGTKLSAEPSCSLSLAAEEVLFDATVCRTSCSALLSRV